MNKIDSPFTIGKFIDDMIKPSELSEPASHSYSNAVEYRTCIRNILITIGWNWE